MTLFQSLIYAFGRFSVAPFFYVFQSHVQNRSLQVYGELVVVLGALCIRHRDASAVLYLLTDTVRMDTDVDDPEQIAEDLYTGKWAKKQ